MANSNNTTAVGSQKIADPKEELTGDTSKSLNLDTIQNKHLEMSKCTSVVILPTQGSRKREKNWVEIANSWIAPKKSAGRGGPF